MKKIAFTILFALIGIMSVNAQEADSLQLMELNARIDSLTTKVNKLQLNYTNIISSIINALYVIIILIAILYLLFNQIYSIRKVEENRR